jgi:hypothetical protein
MFMIKKVQIFFFFLFYKEKRKYFVSQMVLFMFTHSHKIQFLSNEAINIRIDCNYCETGKVASHLSVVGGFSITGGPGLFASVRVGGIRRVQCWGILRNNESKALIIE